MGHLARPQLDMISIVIPTFNEFKTGYLKSILAQLALLDDAEVLVIDGGSTDGTLEVIKDFGVIVEILPSSSRAARLKVGIARSSGELILLHHPRSLVSSDAILSLRTRGEGNRGFWGGFSHKFDAQHPLLKFTSWYSNVIRCDRRSILYLDHCIFFDQELAELASLMPDVEIFEDTELSKIFSGHSSPVRLPEYSTTSAIRFEQNGIYRQALMNQFLKIGYLLKISHKTMNRLYEKGLGLNS
ncbi:MAG: glycosyltransferase involved in cell wall biosynthesis [Pseudohongiellaceae bacterium]